MIMTLSPFLAYLLYLFHYQCGDSDAWYFFDLSTAKGLSIVQVSMYSVVYNICTAVSEVPTGYIGDRIGRKNSIITGTILLHVRRD